MLEPSIKKYIDHLTTVYPLINKVWLFGSRANNTSKPNSDWDFLAFGTFEILKSLHDDLQFHNNSIDLLVVYNNENFESPWGQPKKSGTLSSWHWKEDINIATYRAVKPAHYDENGEKNFNMVITDSKAFQIHPT